MQPAARIIGSKDDPIPHWRAPDVFFSMLMSPKKTDFNLFSHLRMGKLCRGLFDDARSSVLLALTQGFSAAWAPLCKGSCQPVTGSPPKPSASGFGGERRCDGVSETCPASQGRGERYTVRTDETEGLTVEATRQSLRPGLRRATSLYTREAFLPVREQRPGPRGSGRCFYARISWKRCRDRRRRPTAYSSAARRPQPPWGAWPADGGRR